LKIQLQRGINSSCLGRTNTTWGEIKLVPLYVSHITFSCRMWWSFSSSHTYNIFKLYNMNKNFNNVSNIKREHTTSSNIRNMFRGKWCALPNSGLNDVHYQIVDFVYLQWRFFSNYHMWELSQQCKERTKSITKKVEVGVVHIISSFPNATAFAIIGPEQCKPSLLNLSKL
jgi:hypothetical protein